MSTLADSIREELAAVVRHANKAGALMEMMDAARADADSQAKQANQKFDELRFAVETEKQLRKKS